MINPYTKEADIDHISLQKDIKVIITEMDKVLEENVNRHALPEQRDMAIKYRNIGVGIMGLSDMFVKLGIRYGSNESISLANSIMRFLFRESVKASAENGRTFGNFPGYDPKVWDSNIIKKAFSEEEIEEFKKQDTLRNCSLLSIAPTGSIGTMLNISTGCECFFALSYNRRTVSMSGETYKVDIKAVEDYRKVTRNQGKLPDYFITAQDINWKERIDMQAALQEFCDTAISSTINLRKEATINDVKELYKYAWKKGLKGVTIFKEGSRDPILSVEPIKETSCLDCIETVSRKALGEVLKGETYKYQTACGSLYITVNKDENGNIVEIFTNSSKNGTCKANLNGETRLASLALRAGVKTEEVIDTLKSIQCQSCAFAKAKGNKIDGTSCPDIIAKCIKKSYNNENIESNPTNKCPECGAELMHSGGCVQCTCGYSKCN